MPHLHSHKNGEQFQLGDMEALLHDTCWKFGVEKFPEANCSAAGKARVRGEKMRIGNDDVGRYHRDAVKMLQETFPPLQISFSCRFDASCNNATESRYILQYCSADGCWADNYDNYYI